MKFALKDARLAFTKLWTPEAFPGGNDPTKYYSCTLLIPPTHAQYAQINKAMDTLAAEKWPSKGPSVLKAAKAIGKVFFRDGDTKEEYEGFAGNWFISARSKVKPNYFDHQRNLVTEESGILYGGCYVNASLEFYAYTKGNNGLGAGLKGLQFLRKGDAFGGGSPADADDFDEISAPDEGEEDDLTA